MKYAAHFRLIAACLSMALACGGPAVNPETASTNALPELDGIPIYDAPLDAAPAEIQAGWHEYEIAKASVLPQTDNTSMEAINTWANEEFRPWIDLQTAAVNKLGRLPQESRSIDRVFASVLSADIMYAVAESLLAMPIPDEIQGAPEAEQLYIAAIVEQLRVVAATTHDLLSVCQDEAQQMTAPYNTWAQRCAEMDAQLQNETAEFQR